jgi:hypothetical protein
MPRQKLDLGAAAQAADCDKEAPDMSFGASAAATVFDGADYPATANLCWCCIRAGP